MVSGDVSFVVVGGVAADGDLIAAGIDVVACCLFTFVVDVDVDEDDDDEDDLLKSLVGECKPSETAKKRKKKIRQNT